MDELTAIDLCCGAGGWACAAQDLPIRFTAVADIADDCLETWRLNHLADHPDCQVLKLDLGTAASRRALLSACGGRADLVVGGIPCEQISKARDLRGPPDAATIDTWHELLDNCLAIVDALGSRWWALEDVIAIERHLPLPLFHGHDIPHRRIDASQYGPQKRIRTFLGVFPDPEPVAGPRVLGDVLRGGPFRVLSQWSETAAHDGWNHGRAIVWNPDEPARTIQGFGARLQKTPHIPLADRRDRYRVLEWQEAAAVQGFPGDFVFAGGTTRTWKMVGQAIPIQVGRAILTAICKQARGSAGEPTED